MLVKAIKRGLKLFQNKKEYNLLRERAFKSAKDGREVYKQWNKEFHRLLNVVYPDPDIIMNPKELQFKNELQPKFINMLEKVLICPISIFSYRSD